MQKEADYSHKSEVHTQLDSKKMYKIDKIQFGMSMLEAV